MMQLTRRASAVRSVLRDIEEARRDLVALGEHEMHRWHRHFVALLEMEKELRSDWPDEAAEIECWEDERDQDVRF